MAYITQAEYLARYGNAETIRITDETRSGQVDTGKLSSAIVDASDIIDAYLGKFYRLPLAETPALVRHAAGALAREILHTTRPLDAVTAEADRVRKQLELIAKGTLTLPLPLSGVAPIEVGSGGSATSGDGSAPVFTDNALSGFTAPARGAFANWRL